MKAIDNILEIRGYSFESTMQDASVSDMIRLMAGKEVRALLALEAGKLVGIVLEGDQVRKVILTGRSFKETQVREIIAQNVIYTSPEQIDEKCLALTKEKHIRHLPVMADGHLVGIISMGDLARTIVSDQEY